MQSATPAQPEPSAGDPPTRFPGGVIPEWLHLTVGSVVVGALIGVALLWNAAVGQRETRLRSEAAESISQIAAEFIQSSLKANGDEPINATALLAWQGVREIVWTGADGAPRGAWRVPESAETHVSAGVMHSYRAVADVHDPDGTSAGSVSVLIHASHTMNPQTWIVGATAAVVIGTLVTYLLLYRRLQRHLRPWTAIERNLESFAAGVERDMLALSLSDSLGQVASAWNGLLREVSQLHGVGADASGEGVEQVALQRFENRAMRNVLDRLPIGVIRCRSNEQVIYANASAAALLALGPETLEGETLRDLIGEDISTPLLGAHQRGAASEVIDRQSGEGEKDNTLRFRLVPSGETDGERELLLTVEDVTHVREAERARDNFLYHVTHELRTPLTNIHAYAETLGRPDFDDEVTRKECYNVIVSETARLSSLVEDILSVSQLEVGSLRIELSDVDIMRLMRTMVQDHLGTADEKRIDLRLKLPPKVPNIRGDKQRLAILVSNLIGNAIKYTPEGGQVDVQLEVTDGTVRIAVTDTGIGIAVEDQQNVFDKFFRATSEHVQAVPGTGLGLAIMREIARLHGGDIELKSVIGEGSSFIVELPAVRVESCGVGDRK